MTAIKKSLNRSKQDRPATVPAGIIQYDLPVEDDYVNRTQTPLKTQKHD